MRQAHQAIVSAVHRVTISAFGDRSVVNRIARMLAVVVIVCILSPSTLQAQDKPSSDLPLYPLKKGLKWQWKQTHGNVANGKGDHTNEVTDIVTFNKVLCYEIASSPDKYNRRVYIAVKDDGLYRVGEKLGDTRYFDEASICLAKTPFAKSYVWHCNPTTDSPGEDGELRKNILARTEASVSQYPDTMKQDGVEFEAVLVVEERRIYPKPDKPEFEKFSTWYIPGKGPVRRQSHFKSKEQNDWTLIDEYVVTSFSGDKSYKVGQIIVNADDLESPNPVAVDKYRLEPGDEATFRFSRTISREVSLQVVDSTERQGGGALGLDLKVLKFELSGKIKSAVETAVGDKLKDEETRQREITVRNPGKEVREGKIVWVDTYKTGTVDVTQDGKTYQIQFRFPIGTRMESRNK